VFKKAYNRFLLPAMEIGFNLAAPFSKKARTAVESRKKWVDVLETQLESVSRDKPRVLMHVPSVGEFLQGRAVFDELLKKHRNIALTLTYFSPSAEKISASYEPASARSIMPIDTVRNIKRLLDIVDPGLLIYAKTDVWPNLAREARNRGVKQVLIAASLPPDAGRLNPFARGVASQGLKALDLLASISEDDSGRFEALGVDPSKIVTTGDPRFDQTWNRAREVSETDPLFSGMPCKSPTLVAGSTWPADEDVVIEAFAAIKKRISGCRLIMAPHEPNSSHVANIVKRLFRLGLSAATLTEIESNDSQDPDVVVIDRVGVLAKLYYLGSAAFVGGSFDRRVHNTMEPACMNIPVIVGPKYSNAREAQLLIKEGGGFCVADASEMENRLLELFEDRGKLDNAGRAAGRLVEANIGAAKRTAGEIERRFAALLG